MGFEDPPQAPTPEKEPHWLSLEEIQDKMNSILDTRGERVRKPPRIERRPDGLVTLVEYEVQNDDGSVSVYSYLAKGPRSANTVIDIAHFQGDPNNGDWLGGGGTFSDYDEMTGKWTDRKTYD